jgi:hypothetical protein
MGLLTGQCHLNGHLFKLGLVNRPGYDGRKQAFGKISHVLCDCEAFVVLIFRHLGQHVLTAGDLADISVSKVLHIVRSVGLLNA